MASTFKAALGGGGGLGKVAGTATHISLEASFPPVAHLGKHISYNRAAYTNNNKFLGKDLLVSTVFEQPSLSFKSFKSRKGILTWSSS